MNVSITSPAAITVTGSIEAGYSVVLSAQATLSVAVAQLGAKGDVGEGVPEGGTAGQVLLKSTADDYETEWGQVIYYGTGDPPDPAGIPDGAIYIKHEV